MGPFPKNDHTALGVLDPPFHRSHDITHPAPTRSPQNHLEGGEGNHNPKPSTLNTKP